MKAKIFLFLVFSFVLSVFAYAEYAPGKIIVKFKPGVIELPKGASIAGIQKTSVRAASVKALAQKYEVSEIEQLFSKALEIQPKWDRLKNDYVFYFPKDQDVLQVVEDFKNNPNVLYVSPCSIVHAFLAPDDPLYSNQYGLTNIKAPQAWDKTTGSSDNVIAVLDTGADSDHADLLARFDPRGWNFVGSGAGSSDFDDDNGHGTGVIGVVGAITSNEVGVAGVDWQAKILPIKVLDSQGNGSIDDIVQGIEYAAALTNNSVDVINMSFGQNSPDSFLTAACDSANDAGIVLIAAAGNYNSETPSYPANCSSVLAVAAVDQNDKRSVWTASSASNYGTWVDVSAPGTSIWSTQKGGGYYGSNNGTSFASPFVAGVAALIKTQNPSLTDPQSIRQRIKDTADDIDSLNPGYEGKLGTGRINTYRAVAGIFAQITSPESSDYVNGTVNIYGTASGWDFSNYSVEILQNSALIATIETSSVSVESALLGSWSSFAYNGKYTIRLKVFSVTSSSDEATVDIFANNTTPEANITSPADSATVEGDVTILGTATNVYFDKYNLEYGQGAAPAGFISIDNAPGKKSYYASVEAGVLGIWKTAGLSGVYTLRLTAYNKVGLSSSEAITVNINSGSLITKEVVPDPAYPDLPVIYTVPNPFNSTTDSELEFMYDLSGNFTTTIHLFDLVGNLIWQKSYQAGTNGGKAGVNNPAWNGSDLFGQKAQKGVYLYQVVSGNKIIARGRIIII